MGHGSDLLSVPGGVGIDQPTYKERFDPTKGWFVTEEIICHLDNRDAISPGAGTPHPVRTKSYLRFILPAQYRSSPLCKLRLEYHPNPDELEPGDGPGPDQECPPDTITEDGTTVEQDIRLHPDFQANMAQFWDHHNSKFHDSKDNLNPYTGIEAYLIGSLLVISTIYTEAEPASVEPDLGTLADPPDRASAAPLMQYLIVSGNKSKQGLCWCRSLSYQYNKHGWSPLIYS